MKQIIKELVLLINEGVSLKEGFIVRAESSEVHYSQAIERWKYRANVFLEKNIGTEAAVDFKNKTKVIPFLSGWSENICNPLDSGIPILQSIKDDIEQNPEFWVNHLSKNKNIRKISGQSTMNSIDKVRNICSRFHIVATRLKDHRHENRNTITIVYDVQDLLHALLKIFFNDIRPEEWTPSYAGKSSRMDFLLKKEKIVIEVKKTREGMKLKEKQIADQIIIDIDRYKVSHPDCETLFCFVYDPENLIQNPTGVEEDINKKHKGFAEVLICPRGL